VSGHVRHGPSEALRVPIFPDSGHVEKVASGTLHVSAHQGVVVVQHAPLDVRPEAPHHSKIDKADLQIFGALPRENF